MGATSLQLSQIAERIEQKFGCELTVADLFTYPSIADLAAFLVENHSEIKQTDTAKPSRSSSKDIAIIGMSLNVPGHRIRVIFGTCSKTVSMAFGNILHQELKMR